MFLQGAQGLFAASDRVEPQEWRTCFSTVQAQDFGPGFEGIGYITLITAQRLTAFLAELRREDLTDFVIYPPGKRSLHAPITYLEPETERNRRAVGFDMLSEPVRRAALERACDTGEAALSGKVMLGPGPALPTSMGPTRNAPRNHHPPLLHLRRCHHVQRASSRRKQDHQSRRPSNVSDQITRTQPRRCHLGG